MPIERPRPAGKHCRHYNYEGGLKGGPRCAVGVDLSQPGSTQACMPPKDGMAACAKREENTEAERAAWEAYREQSMERMVKIMPLIPGSSRDRKKRDHWGKQGAISPCPGCGEGTVRWVRSSYNGHIHAACTTVNCFAVME